MFNAAIDDLAMKPYRKVYFNEFVANVFRDNIGSHTFFAPF